jgi:hypothetical protein
LRPEGPRDSKLLEAGAQIESSSIRPPSSVINARLAKAIQPRLWGELRDGFYTGSIHAPTLNKYSEFDRKGR